MNNRIKLTIIAILSIMAINTINIVSAASVQVVNGKLSTQLHEGEQVDFSIQIKTDLSTEKNITIETNLISSDNNPIYDFGELNPSITSNRYNQKITLDTSTLPKIFQVKISGKVPNGEIQTKPDDSDDNLVISKFINTELKFFEIHADQNLAGIESFKLIINKKEKFDSTLQSIRRPEFDKMKSEIQKLFDSGFPNEAQNLANEMSNIKFPDSLTLFGVLKISNDMFLNILVIITVIVIFSIGYIAGAKPNDEPYNHDD